MLLRALAIIALCAGTAHAAPSCDDLLAIPVFLVSASASLQKELATPIDDGNRGDILSLELIQDATHILAAMPGFLPDRAFLFLAKRAMGKRMAALLALPKRDPRLPQILEMKLGSEEQMIAIITVRREHLAAVITDYFKSLNHPALGNSVIRMDVLP